jgi:hypothetical protein
MASGVVLTPFPVVYNLFGEGGGIRTRVSWASGTVTFPMSYSALKAIPALSGEYWNVVSSTWMVQVPVDLQSYV